MAEKNRTIAVRLVRIEFLSKGGEALSAKTRHALVSTVHWPRYSYQARTTVREVEVSGAVREYGEKDWIDAILFKENVQLPSAVTLTLSVPVARDVVSKMVAAMAKAGAGIAGDAAEAASPSAAVGKIATAPFDAVASLLGSSSDPAELGCASLLFSEDLVARGGEAEVEFVAREDVSARVSQSPSSTGARRRKTVLRKGKVAARAVLAFDAIG